MSRPTDRPRRGEEGQVTVMIVGFALVVLLLVAVVVDASAAYLQRQRLDTLADGAALYGADAGVAGREVYTDGLTGEALEITPARARAAVGEYLASVGAQRRYPGLRYEVRMAAGSEQLVVEISAPVDLPLTVPGVPDSPRVAATGAARVVPEVG